MNSNHDKLEVWGPGIPQIFGTSYKHTYSMRNSNQILHGDQTRCEENIYRDDHAPVGLFWWKFLVKQMLTHNLFTVASLHVTYEYNN